MLKQLKQWLRGEPEAPVTPAADKPDMPAAAGTAPPGIPGVGVTAPAPELPAAPDQSHDSLEEQGLHPLQAGAAPATAGALPPTGLLGKALDERNLLEAWERVRDNDGAAGTDGQGVRAFGVNVLGRLQLLKGEVIKGSYSPQPLRRVSIPKGDGKLRWLAIPSVRDRVLQTACGRVLRPILEPEFEESSYGYRTGRSVAQAIARVVRHRDSGAVYVVDADIESFFDNISHKLLEQAFGQVVSDKGMRAIVGLWLAAIVREEGPSKPGRATGGPRSYLLTRGVPQGSPLSPMLANVYLDALDEEMLALNLGLVRYADDFVICCRSAQQAAQALEAVEASLAKLKLKLNRKKTRLTSFESGFDFLGVRFKGRMIEAIDPDSTPWLVPDAQDGKTAQHHERNELQRALAAEAAASGLTKGDLATAVQRVSVAGAGLAGAQSLADERKVYAEAVAALPRRAYASEDAPHRSLDPAGDPALDESDGSQDDTASIDLSSAGREGSAGDALVRLSAEPAAAPLLQSLYVGEHGSWLSKEGERVVVSKGRTVMASVPLGQLDQIAVLANAMVSTALLRYCSHQRIGLYLGDAAAGPAATLDRGALPDIELFSLQAQRSKDIGFAVHVANACVEGKLHNSKLILRRFARSTARALPHLADRQKDEAVAAVAKAVQQIDDAQYKLRSAPDVSVVRGLEGAAAKAYFEGFKALLPGAVQFPGRRKRPPKDPANALMSFGYGVLAANVQCLVRLAGLNAHLGHLHAPGPGSQALVSDLMEEFRAPVVDAVVLTLLRDGALMTADFEWDESADLPCKLKPEARRLFVKALEAKLERPFVHPRFKKVTDLRRAMQAQVRHYIAVLHRHEPAYLPLRLK